MSAHRATAPTPYALLLAAQVADAIRDAVTGAELTGRDPGELAAAIGAYALAGAELADATDAAMAALDAYDAAADGTGAYGAYRAAVARHTRAERAYDAAGAALRGDL